jgi:predicted DsbA family dithiol-disulfide isomerase
MKEAREASRWGVSGVPSFDFNRKPDFSGNQPVEKILKILQYHSGN